jgi:hypothetical protein
MGSAPLPRHSPPQLETTEAEVAFHIAQELRGINWQEERHQLRTLSRRLALIFMTSEGMRVFGSACILPAIPVHSVWQAIV